MFRGLLGVGSKGWKGRGGLQSSVEGDGKRRGGEMGEDTERKV